MKKQRLLLVDNYDSFTWNLVHLLRDVGVDDVDVRYNDQISLDEVGAYDRVVLSPGPGLPQESGILMPLLERHLSRLPILGVCLGHQAIAQALGAKLINLEQVHHGTASAMRLDEDAGALFRDVPDGFMAGRYHSWVVDAATLPPELRVTARDAQGTVMALQHRTLPIVGVQFHPESVLTEHGATLMRNFLALAPCA